ncbi:MAG: hypothetical protein GSR85_00115 [Desulfurococcales archaeon]|nr:hypothetical protein [Desulfurococcales archaeon]
MTSSTPYPQVFLDANALVKVAYSISHHHRDPKGRKSALRFFMEQGVLVFSTGVQQLIKTIELIEEGEAETLGFTLDASGRVKVIVELLAATRGPSPLIRVITTSDLEALDECRRRFHERLSQSWAGIVDWDEEDMLMIREASLAYARYGLVKTTRGVYRPRPMILASDDRQVQAAAGRLDEGLKDAALSTTCIEPLASQYSNPILHVISYEHLKRLVQEYTS